MAQCWRRHFESIQPTLPIIEPKTDFVDPVVSFRPK